MVGSLSNNIFSRNFLIYTIVKRIEDNQIHFKFFKSEREIFAVDLLECGIVISSIAEEDLNRIEEDDVVDIIIIFRGESISVKKVNYKERVCTK